MNRKQENKVNMYQNVKGVLDSNKNVYEPYPRLVEAANNFKTGVAEIIKIGTQAGMDTTGITDSKTEAKDKMAAQACELAGSLKALAFDKNDLQLASAIDFSYSDIRYAAHIEALQTANVILEEINDHIEELAAYMVSAEDAEELKNCIELFEDLSESKGQVKNSSVADTKRLAQLFRKTDDLLSKSLDQLILRLKRKHPVFYDIYMNARNIVDY